MSAIFWLVFLFILARIFFRLMERTGSKGKFDGPLGGPSPDIGRPIPGSREKLKLKIPEYLTMREEQPGKDMEAEPSEGQREQVILAGKIAEPCSKGKTSGLYPEGSLEGAAVKALYGGEGKNEKPARMRHKRDDPEDLFNDMLCPAQIARGMAWSVILGPRGGLRPKR